MKFVIKIQDIRHGWNGIKIVWREEWHFKYQVLVSAFGLSIAYLLHASPLELLLFFTTLCIALGSEVVNTAVEDIGNKISPDFDERIGAIKDMSQSFVIISSLPAIATFAWIVLPRFW